MHDNDIFMHGNERFVTKMFMDEISMREILHGKISHESSLGEKENQHRKSLGQNLHFRA